jgi:benzoate-CoA ligase family protein
MPFEPPERFNIADYFLVDRLAEGRGDRTAILTAGAAYTYAEVDDLANRYGNLLLRADVRPEERVLIALPDGPEFVAAIFGTLKIGAVVVMLNPHVRPDEIEYFYDYTAGAVLLVSADRAPFFRAVAENMKAAVSAGGPKTRVPRDIFVVDGDAFRERAEAISAELETLQTHPDDAAIWLFSGGTTGHPKAVVQTHASFANTTECYARNVIEYDENDITISVPKLFFGYATGSNLFFPFAAGGATALFGERCTPETLLDAIERFRPTILVNVPTMINQLLADDRLAERDLSSLRLATSAGEALPAELHRKWDEAVGVDLLDGLGTAEMWHIFLSNRPGDVHPGTLGRVVPGFDVRVRDDDGTDLPDGEVGWLWVRGNSRALGYWRQARQSAEAFRGEWYVSGDMIQREPNGVFLYCGRGDDMLKVKGKWLSPGEVENCLMTHEDVAEVAVVGVPNSEGLVRPVAWVIPAGPVSPNLGDVLREHVASRLASYKAPAVVHVVADLPRTHLGKVDRGELRSRP